MVTADRIYRPSGWVARRPQRRGGVQCGTCLPSAQTSLASVPRRMSTLAVLVSYPEWGLSEPRSCRETISSWLLYEGSPRTIAQRASQWDCECSGPDALIEYIVAPELERPSVILSSDPHAQVNPDIRFLDVAGEWKVGPQDLGR